MRTWTDVEADIETSNWGACFEAARKAGHNDVATMLCEDGSLDCPACPFKTAEEIARLNETQIK